MVKRKLTPSALTQGSGAAAISALRGGQRSIPLTEPLYTREEGDMEMYGCDVHRKKGESRGQSHST